jgi:uncharacterized repeat protein (TIGR01451 family)
MLKVKYKLGLLISLIILGLSAVPGRAYAQWPPFSFNLASSYADGKITYNVQFSSGVDWPMADVVIKIPLPEGTRFLEASAPPSTTVNFDGAEITLLTPTLNGSINDTFFVVEVTNPGQTEFTTHAWISWQGQQPGDYLIGDQSIDITRTPLNWEKAHSRLRLEAAAIAAGDTITYLLYPKNIGGRRMWDLTITVPVPEGTTFLSASAPPSFAAGFDGQQVVFSTLEMPRRTDIEPLRFQVSTAGVATPFVETQAWAGWTNVGRNVPQQEQTKSGDIIVQPHARQFVIADSVDDTPLANYDLTSLAFEEDGAMLKTTFYTAEAMGSVGQPVEYFLYIDSDCNAKTGKPRGYRGAEYWVRYRHQSGKAYFYTWDPLQAQWANRREISAYPSAGNLVTVWVPANLIEDNQQFCWLAVAWNRTEAYHPNLPVDWLGREPRLTQFDALFQ